MPPTRDTPPLRRGSAPAVAALAALAALAVLAVLAAAALAGCMSTPASAGSRPARPTAQPKTPAMCTAHAGPPKCWSETALLAQLLMVGATYRDLGGATTAVHDGAGGVVLFGDPAPGSGPAVVAGIAALRRAAAVPLLTSTDEEGGSIARLATLVGALPWPRQMAEEWSPATVTQRLAAVASKMRALGVDMDLAPVLDTASAGDTVDEESVRSFSETPATAAAYGLAFLRGLAEGGVVGVVKHFPGLGHANADTDLGPATDPPIGRLAAADLVPFRAAIAAGVRVVMMSNVTEPAWGKAPASINRAAYTYLRGLGFAGMVLTDSLDAGAIGATGADGARAAVEAIEAGADMAILQYASDFPAALEGLESAVASGKLPMSRVISSVERIIAVKDSVLPAAEVIPPPA